MIGVTLTRCRPADNPFASHRLDMCCFWHREVDADQILQRLERIGGRGAIVGSEGSGKTTLLEEIGWHIPGRVMWVRIPGSDPHPLKTAFEQLRHPVTPQDSVLIDGSEQLGPIGWQRFLLATMRAGRMVATLHRPGRLATLFECTTDPDLLSDLVHFLAPEDAPILEPHLPGLLHRNDGNIRLCFRELYDLYAGRPTQPRPTRPS